MLRHSLALGRKSIISLSAGTAVFFFFVLYASAAFLEDFAIKQAFLQKPPKAVEALMGGSVNFFTPTGWLLSSLTHPITLALFTASALVIAAGAVSTEIERGTADLVLSRPVARGTFLASKAAGAVVAVTLVHAAGLMGTLAARLTISKLQELQIGDIFALMGGSWVLFTAIAMVGILVSARTSLRGRTLGIASGFVVVGFFINFLALLIDGIYWARFLSPFHYFRPAEMAEGKAAADLLVLVALGVAAMAAATFSFEKRDLSG